MRRLRFAAVLLGLATLLTVAFAVTPTGSRSPDTAQAAAAGSTKITGTITATFHQSFKQYVESYDATTTADVVWEEKPDLLLFCHCRPFLPTDEGHIDWTYRHHSVGGSGEDCTDETGGRLVGGAGLYDEKEQMLQFVDDPDVTKFFFWGVGHVYATGQLSFHCDPPTDVNAIDFLHLPGPEEWITTTPTPAPAAAPAAAPVALCSEASPFEYARTATRIQGSCYEYYGDDESTLEFTKYEWDLLINPEPIIFIHGFLGSEIICGGDKTWPKLPPTLVEMALAGDGVSPAPGACTGSVGNIVETVAGSPVYKTAVDFLNQLTSGDVTFFTWDWRKGPQESITALDSKIGQVRAKHNNAKVVIMAHSYGGLLTRLYLDGAGHADNVARVITIGTPALGSPKALFPLYAGIETPDFSALDALIDNDNLHEFARNLAGDYFLYPSAAYGPWLRIDPSATALDRAGLVEYVRSLEGNGSLLETALDMHASALDPAYPASGGPKFEVVVGTGKATIVGIDILAHGRVRIRYGNGDRTVPAISAARGPLGAANPNKLHTHYSCGVEHVPLPGDPQITDAIDDFLRFGDPIDGLDSPCPFRGVEFKHFYLPPIVSGAGEAAPAADDALSVEEAETQGVADYLDLPNEKFIITDQEFPKIKLGQGKFLQVTPLSEEANGKPVVYGPLNGAITISGDATNGPLVQLDGKDAPLSGDVNCDRQVTVLDALLLVVHASGATGPATGCAPIGSGTDPFGDVDCDTGVTATDGLAALQLVAGVEPTLIENGCRS